METEMETINAPYIGPRPFEQSDRDIFFGRTQEANELVSLITAHPVVLLYALSGGGKTSLVKAGLIPLLVDEEHFHVLPPMRVRENVAGCKPEGVQNIYMFNALSSISPPDAVNGFAKLSLADYLASSKTLSDNNGYPSPTVAIFDQFEELFTLYPEHWEERECFFKQVRDALRKYPLLRVVFSMREDFIAELDPYASLLPEKLRTRFRMEALREKTALGAVTEPLKRVQTNGTRKFAPGVAESLVHNLLDIKVRTPEGVKKVSGEFVEALQLQVVCQALWENLSPTDDLITAEHLDAFGDVDKALMHFYENAIEKTSTSTGIKQGKLRTWIERTLITPNGTRGTVFRGDAETGGIPNAVVDELENQRIIRMELRGGAQWYELTHDRFVETVQASNQKWLLARPAVEQARKRLEEKAADWDRNDRNEKNLLDDVELSVAERWMASSDASEIEPSRELTAYLRASRHLSETKAKENQDREQRLEQEAKTARLFRKLTKLIGTVTVLGAVALCLAVVLGLKARAARQQAETTTVKLELLNADLKRQYDDLEKKDRLIEQSTTLTQAYTALGFGKLDEAEDKFRTLLKTYEDQKDLSAVARTHSSLGDIALKRRDYTAAKIEYDKAVQILSREPRFSNQLGQTLSKTGLLYFEWGKNKEEQKDLTGAAKKYETSIAVYNKGRDAFKKADNQVGVIEATSGYNEAKKHYDDVQEELNKPPEVKLN
jgi:tetratricopeptide (TPR) repeat protein